MTTDNSKILTKNTNRGFQIRVLPKTTAEQEKALREQLHAEIENKTKACSNIVYDCTLPRIEGYGYCLKHILQDAKAPYKQCAYLYPINGKRCTQPAPKYDPKKDVFTNYCFEHSRLSQLTKTRNTVGKFQNVETNETLLHGLAHHVNAGRANRSHLNDDRENDVDISKPYIDPFVDIESVLKNDTKLHILDYASDSSSDDDMPTVSNTWKGADMEGSDNESVDSLNEDVLKHAEIYTTEEATMITKQKMVRLQSLYIDQIHRLQYILKDRRRKYLQNLKIERESLCSIHDQAKETLAEKRMYERLKAMNKFHKRNGVEAVLHRKFIEKRLKATEGYTNRPLSFHTKCTYTEGGVKCGERILPACKFCKKHILEDKKQILFRPCYVEKSGVVCQEPVPNIFEDSTCVLHIELPPMRHYEQKISEKIQ